jgi:hypothetical protein
MSGTKEPTGDVDSGAVDVSLIDAMLALTPEQRLRQNDRMLKTIQELNDGFAARRARDPALPLAEGARAALKRPR